MDFLVLDFETACSHDTPCALGLTIIEDNAVVRCGSFLINPESDFNPWNTKIHGISTETVREAPTFPQLWASIQDLFQQYPIVAHNMPYDYTVLKKTCARYNLVMPEMTLYCTLQLSRLAWPHLPKHTLDYLCEQLNINLQNHHCCSDDAMASANLMLYLTGVLGENPPTYQPASSEKKYYWYGEQDKSPSDAKELEQSTTTTDLITSLIFENKLFVVTGEFDGYTRAEIENSICKLGGICKPAITKKTDYLIVGLQDLNRIRDTENIKSTKIIKAEQLKQNGHHIKIISGYDFIKILEDENERSVIFSK